MEELTRTYKISIHALREEGDRNGYRYNQKLEDFYPRPPRGGRPAFTGGRERETDISIHALREEGDVIDGNNAVSYEISIHALREEGDFLMMSIPIVMSAFLSTPSARRATA